MILSYYKCCGYAGLSFVVIQTLEDDRDYRSILCFFPALVKETLLLQGFCVYCFTRGCLFDTLSMMIEKVFMIFLVYIRLYRKKSSTRRYSSLPP